MKTILFATLLFLLQACSKKSDNKDRTAPVITIISPANNQQFTSGQMIQVMANATDNNKLTELHIHVTNKATGVLLRDIHSYPNQASGSVQDSFTADVGINYIIEIIAKDPDQNLAASKVEVSAN